MPGQKRATPTVERDPTKAPSMAAVATGAARRSERRSVASFTGCATASSDAFCAESADDAAIPSAPARCTIVRNFFADIELRRPKVSQLAVAPNDLKLAVARLAFWWGFAGGEGADVIRVPAPVYTFEDVLVHIRILRQLIGD
jgi:hypothetical protein